MAIPTVQRKPSDPDAPLLARLDADAGIEHLASSLQLNEGFELDLLVCSAHRIARAALRVLRAQLAVSENEPTHFEILDPYKTRRDSSQALDLEAAVQAVLVPLISNEAHAFHNRPGRTIVVLDASLAYERDEPAWRHIFRRLNEGRNVLIERLQVPLLLCLPEFLEPVFAHEAPDFWSVRSLVVPLAVALEPLIASDVETVAESQVPARLLGEPSSFDPDYGKLAEDLVEARNAVAANPNDTVASEALAIQLERTGAAEMRKGRPRNALDAFEESRAIRKLLLSREPDRSDWVNALVTVLLDVGDASRELGDLQGALAALRDAVGIARVERPRLLSATLVPQAILDNETGEPDRALAGLEEAISLLRSVPNQETPDLKLLALALTLCGHICQKRGDLDRALAAFSEALRLNKEIFGAQHPRTVDTMESLAHLYWDRGDVSQSRRIWESVHDARKEQLGIEHPKTWSSMVGLATTLAMQGDYRVARELLDRVLDTQRRISGPDDPKTRATEELIAKFIEIQSLDDDVDPA